MQEPQQYDALIITTPGDYERLALLHRRVSELLPARNIYVIGAPSCQEQIDADGIDNIKLIDENSIVPFDDVRAVVEKHLESRLNGQPAPRGIIGWYYQQILKLEYANRCEDEYYLTWDGDTVPARAFTMFSEEGVPYLDMKHEYNKPYFDTIERLLPGMTKKEDISFISEHMLFDREIVKNLIADIEANDDLMGNVWWEKMINSIPVETYTDGEFSEFETYGTYVLYKYPEAYKLRTWNSFRYAAYFLNPATMLDRDWQWLAKDFFALSFEKNQEIRADHANIFDNPKYQQKLSARQVLEICQEEMSDSYVEVWDD